MIFRRLKHAATFILAAVLAAPLFASAAELSFSPASGNYTTGKEFSVKVLVNPGVDSVNAADGTVQFDKDVLSVSSVSKDGSAFSLWTADPSFSNSDGTVTFSGGTPTAFSKSGTVVTIKFKGKKAGTGKVTIAKGSVLAADGKGTDVYSKGGEASYTIADGAKEPDPPPAAAPETAADPPAGEAFGGSPPIAPTITSSTHPKEENWYATSTVKIDWKIPPDVVGIKMLFSDKEDQKPNVVLKADVGSSTQSGVADGVWYFYLQFKNEAGWGEIGKRKIQIDTVQPAEFDLSLAEEDAAAPKLKFKTTDDRSGMDRYEIYLNETQVGIVKDSDLVDGAYPVPPQEGGPAKVKIKAYDKAGNIREAAKDLTLPKVVKAAKGGKTEEVQPQGFFTTERILLILFAFIIGVLATVNIYRNKNTTAEKLRILTELAAVRDKNDKIFSAMREEFEQMVQDLDVKPQLSPTERDLLEKIKEVLEISEELVDTGMDELKKTIRG